MAVSSKIAVEKDQPGQPHQGKVFVAVHAHLDDVPYFAGGLCAKLMQEGYTGYIVRTCNDEQYGGRAKPRRNRYNPAAKPTTYGVSAVQDSIHSSNSRFRPPRRFRSHT